MFTRALNNFTTVTHTAWHGVKGAGQASATWMRQTKDQTIAKVQNLWHNTKQSVWENGVKASYITNKERFQSWCRENPEYLRWKNIAFITAEVASPILVSVITGVAIGIELVPLASVAGFFISIALAHKAARDIDRIHDEQARPDLETMKRVVKRAKINHFDVNSYWQCKEAKTLDVKGKYQHRKEEMDKIHKEVGELRETINKNKKAQFESTKQAIIRMINNLQGLPHQDPNLESNADSDHESSSHRNRRRGSISGSSSGSDSGSDEEVSLENGRFHSTSTSTASLPPEQPTQADGNSTDLAFEVNVENSKA